jgi:hypothetical protein
MELWHYSINTGHGRWSPRSEVADDIIEILRPLIESGEHDTPMEGYRLSVPKTELGLFCTMKTVGRPVMSMMVAASQEDLDHLWPFMESMYYSVSEVPGLRSLDYIAASKPDKLPTCIAWPMFATPQEAMWLGDFERCLAWTFLDAKI